MGAFGSYCIFLVLLILGAIIATIAECTNEKKYVFILIVLLTFIAGARGINVGWDTRQYIHIFTLIVNKDPTLSWYGIEKSFTIICSFVFKIFNDSNIMFFLMALVTNALIIFRLWDFRKMANFSWMFFCYYCMFYTQTMNISRQFCAVALLFWGTRYFFRKEYVKYFIFILLAFLFHKSALIGIIVYIFDIKNWKYLDFKNRIFILFGIVLIPILGSKIFVNLESYLRYFNTVNANVGIMLPLKLSFWCITGYKLEKIICTFNKKQINAYENIEQVLQIKYIYLAGLLISFLGYFFSYMERIGLPFYIFEPVYMGIIVVARKDRKIIKLILFFLCLYQFSMDMYGNGQGIIPYQFFWQ